MLIGKCNTIFHLFFLFRNARTIGKNVFAGKRLRRVESASGERFGAAGAGQQQIGTAGAISGAMQRPDVRQTAAAQRQAEGVAAGSARPEPPRNSVGLCNNKPLSLTIDSPQVSRADTTDPHSLAFRANFVP